VLAKGSIAYNTGLFAIRANLIDLTGPKTLLLGYAQANATLEIVEVHITNTNIRYAEQLTFGIMKLASAGLAKGTATNAISLDGTAISQSNWVYDLIVEPDSYFGPYDIAGVVNTNGYHYVRERRTIKASPGTGIGICLLTPAFLPFNCECVVIFRQTGG
jgi:hypothetical protein